MRILLLLPIRLCLLAGYVASALVTSPAPILLVSIPSTTFRVYRSQLFSIPDPNIEPGRSDQADSDEIDVVSAPVSAGRYDVSKLVGGADDGAGFNQFDPVLKATGFLSRRFGIAGGLAVVAALAALEGREIIQSMMLSDPEDVVGINDGSTANTVTTPSGLRITEVRIGKSGSVPLPGYIVGIRTVVSIGDKIIYNTGSEKPVAFKLGQRPFQNVICEGVEEGIQGMRVGGKRILQVPKNLAPPGVNLPPDVPLVYEVELTEVLSGYF